MKTVTRLPKRVIIGHRKWKIRAMPKARALKVGLDGLCDYQRGTIWVWTDKQHASVAANTLLHEIFHAAWNEGELDRKHGEERIVSVLANGLTQIIRDNPKVFDWIAEKARA